MSFDEKYKLLDLVEDAKTKTFVARETATGREVNVFLFVGEQARIEAEILELLSKTDAAIFPELIETGTNQSTPYVVTLPLAGYVELKKRTLQLRTASPSQPRHDFSKAGVWHVPQPPEAEQALSKPATSESIHLFESSAAAIDESTMKTPSAHVESLPPENPAETPAATLPHSPLFESTTAPAAEPEMQPAASSPVEETAPTAPSVSEPEPGEFTRMFKSPAAVPAEDTAKTPAPAAAPSAQEHAPGEFTRLFQAPAIPPKETSAPPSAASVPTRKIPSAPESVNAEPGEFTRMFRSPAAVPAEDTAKTPAAAAAPSAQEHAPGEFTRLFQAPVAPPQETSAPPAPASVPTQKISLAPESVNAEPGEFTRMFRSPAAPMGESTFQTPPAQATPVTPLPETGPGEFTRLFQSPSIPSGPLPGSSSGQSEFEQLFGEGTGSAAPAAPGQFTQIFRTPDSAPTTQLPGGISTAPPPSYTPPAGEFTKVFGTPSLEMPASPPAIPSMPAAPSVPSTPDAPGEYTRMFSAQPSLPVEEPSLAPPQVPDVAAPAPLPASAAKHNSKMPLIVGGVIVLLLIVIIVLLLTMRK